MRVEVSIRELFVHLFAEVHPLSRRHEGLNTLLTNQGIELLADTSPGADLRRQKRRRKERMRGEQGHARRPVEKTAETRLQGNK